MCFLSQLFINSIIKPFCFILSTAYLRTSSNNSSQNKIKCALSANWLQKFTIFKKKMRQN